MEKLELERRDGEAENWRSPSPPSSRFDQLNRARLRSPTILPFAMTVWTYACFVAPIVKCMASSGIWIRLRHKEEVALRQVNELELVSHAVMCL
jgi:hypothetical protein